MAVLTIRDKNQVTLPRRLMDEAGLKMGDPIEFESLPDGGIGIYAFGRQARRSSLWDMAVALSRQIPDIEDTELVLPSRQMETRDVEW